MSYEKEGRLTAIVVNEQEIEIRLNLEAEMWEVLKHLKTLQNIKRKTIVIVKGFK